MLLPLSSRFLRVAMAPLDAFKQTALSFLGIRDEQKHTLPFYLVRNEERLLWWLEQYSQTEKNDLTGYSYAENSVETIFHWAVIQGASVGVFKALLQHVPDLVNISKQGELPIDMNEAGASNLKQAMEEMAEMVNDKPPTIRLAL